VVVGHALDEAVPDDEHGSQRKTRAPQSKTHLSIFRISGPDVNRTDFRYTELHHTPHRIEKRLAGAEAAVNSDEIKKLYEWLQSRVVLHAGGEEPVIRFEQPTVADFSAEGFGEEAVALTLDAAWWKEMVVDIVETPEFAEPDDSPEQVLRYARDVVREYIWKRLY
jgi:hypothetical protein